MIKIYGADWCADCVRAKFVFEEFNIAYEFINTDIDESAAKYVEEINNGIRYIPTILFEDGSLLVEPDRDQLIEKFTELKLL